MSSSDVEFEYRWDSYLATEAKIGFKSYSEESLLTSHIGCIVLLISILTITISFV